MKLKDLLSQVKRTSQNLILVRHGQCISNTNGVLLGWQDSKLTIAGRQQASSLYPAFLKNKDILFKNKPISSDLSRSIDTL